MSKDQQSKVEKRSQADFTRVLFFCKTGREVGFKDLAGVHESLVQKQELPRVTQGTITSSKKKAKKKRVKIRVAAKATVLESNTRSGGKVVHAATVQPQR